MHGRFFENFIEYWKITLVTYKNESIQAVQTTKISSSSNKGTQLFLNVISTLSASFKANKIWALLRA